MPMIDVYASAGTFADPHSLAAELARTLMVIEQVPDIPMFRQNTAAFVHDLPAGALSNVDGESNYVRVQVLTNAGALDRDKQLAVVEQFTDLLSRLQAIRSTRSACGCFSPKRSTVGGDSGATPTPTRSWSMPPALRSPSCRRRSPPADEGPNSV